MSGYCAKTPIVNLFKIKYIHDGDYVCTVFIDFEKLLIQWITVLKYLYLIDNSLSLYPGSSSEMTSFKHGVFQGSALGPLLFLLYINDLNSLCSKTITIDFAFDSHLSYLREKQNAIESAMNYELNCLAEWFKSKILSFDFEKPKLAMVLSKSRKGTRSDNKQN